MANDPSTRLTVDREALERYKRQRLGAQKPEEQESTFQPSKARLAAAGGTRALTGILGGLFSGIALGPGSIPAAGIGAGGEYLAQAIEEGIPLSDLNSPSEIMDFILDKKRAARAAFEGGIAAVPGGVLAKGGRPLYSALASGALAGGGEVARTKLRGDDLSLGNLAMATGAGAGIGALFGRFLPVKGTPTATPRPTSPSNLTDLIQQAGDDSNIFRQNLPSVMRKEGWHDNLTTIWQKAKELEDTGQAGLAQTLRETGILGLDDGSEQIGKIIKTEFEALVADGKLDDALLLGETANKLRKGGAPVSTALTRLKTSLGKSAEKTAKEQQAKTVAQNATKELETLLEGLAAKGVKPKINVSTKVQGVIDPITGRKGYATVSYRVRVPGTKGTKTTIDVPEGPDSSSAVGMAPAPPAEAGVYLAVAPDGTVVTRLASEKEVDALLSASGQNNSFRIVNPVEVQAKWDAALKASKLPLDTVTPRITAVSDATISGGNRSAVVGTSAHPTPSAAPIVASASPIKAEFLGWQEVPGEKPFALYTVLDGPSKGSTVSAETLQQLGIEVPQVPSNIPRKVVSQEPPKLPMEPSDPSSRAIVADGERAGNILMTGERTRELLGMEPAEALAKGLVTQQKAAGFPGVGYRIVVQEGSGAIPVRGMDVTLPPVSGKLDVPVVPVVDAPLISSGISSVVAQPVITAPSKLSPDMVKALMGRGISKAKAEGMSIEEAQGLLVTPPAPPKNPLRSVTGTETLGELPQRLTTDEKISVLNTVSREVYPEQLATQLEPLSSRYHALDDQIRNAGKPAKGTPEATALQALRDEKGRIGTKMKVLVDDAEDSGLIEKGLRNSWKERAEKSLEQANADKIARGVSLAGEGTSEGEAARLVSQGVIPEERIPAVVDDLKAGAQAATETEIDDATLAAQRASDPVDDFTPEMVEKARGIKQGIIDGTIAPEEADRLSAELAEEYLKKNLPAAKKDDGGFTISMAGGGAESLLKKYPEVAIKTLLIAGGALTGAVTDPADDPILSALLGAGAGYAGSKGLMKLMQQLKVDPSDVPGLSKAMKDDNKTGLIAGLTFAGKNILRLYPHVQRTNYLTSVPGLMANVFIGPYGAGTFGAVTKMLARDPRGGKALHELLQPQIFIREFRDAQPEAARLIRIAAAGELERSEQHGDVVEMLVKKLGGDKNLSDYGRMTRAYLQGPGIFMAQGDIAIRRILRRAGFSEAEARTMTLTSEPVGTGFKGILDAKRSFLRDRSIAGPIFDTMAPFVRTPLNILEQGLMRLPILGPSYQKAVGLKTSAAELLVQQSLSVVLGSASFIMGATLPPEHAAVVRRFLANASGQYAMASSFGFAAGQGYQRTESPLNVDAGQALEYMFPFPTTDPLKNWWNAGTNMLSDEREFKAPPGSLPKVFGEVTSFLGGGDDQGSSMLTPSKLRRQMKPIIIDPTDRL